MMMAGHCARSGAEKCSDDRCMPPPILFLFLPKRLRPQARVGGQPPPMRRHLGRRQMGRTRKGYAASVSGTAANGCAVDGPKEKNAARLRLPQNRHASARGVVYAEMSASGYPACLHPMALVRRARRGGSAGEIKKRGRYMCPRFFSMISASLS